jgi:hypothetical protein
MLPNNNIYIIIIFKKKIILLFQQDLALKNRPIQQFFFRNSTTIAVSLVIQSFFSSFEYMCHHRISMMCYLFLPLQEAQ